MSKTEDFTLDPELREIARQRVVKLNEEARELDRQKRALMARAAILIRTWKLDDGDLT